MGTTLTGTTPQDTYDSLIKVTDNGPLTGSLKKLTDGLGNDSSLSLSTTAASLSGTLAVTGNVTIDTSTLVVDAANNRVGVGTASPDHPLQVNGNVLFKNSLNNAFAFFAKESDDSGTLYLYNNGTLKNVIATNGNSYLTGGNVGIGINNPVDGKLCVAGATAAGNAIVQTYLTVAAASTRVTADGRYAIGLDGAAGATERVSVTVNGLTFNGDTAAANALDDYEEGTWTPVFTMGTSGTITMDTVLGRYTKVGNLVTCTGFANIASVSSPVGELRLGGLPFTTGSGADAAVNLFIYNFGNTTALTAYQGLIAASLNYAIIRGYNNGAQVQDIGANVIGGAGMIFTITYRV